MKISIVLRMRIYRDICELPALFTVKFQKSFPVSQLIIEQLETLTGKATPIKFVTAA